MPSVTAIKSATWTTIVHLSEAISPASAPSTLPTEAPPTPSDVAHSLSYLLTRTLPLHTKLTTQALEPLRRPPFLTRAWPYLLSVPVVTLVLGRTIYNSRDTLWRWSMEAGETVRSFLVDWVVEPVRGILETVRGGEGTGMTLMGKESLKSDLQVSSCILKTSAVADCSWAFRRALSGWFSTLGATNTSSLRLNSPSSVPECGRVISPLFSRRGSRTSR